MPVEERVLSVGFTGTQVGMTDKQKERLTELLTSLDFEAHHGGCWGSDIEFHDIAGNLPGCRSIIVHLSHLQGPGCEFTVPFVKCPVQVLPPLPPLDRNQDIVRCSELVIACPKEDHEVVRSGTWATVREARKAGVMLVILLPNGGRLHNVSDLGALLRGHRKES